MRAFFTVSAVTVAMVMLASAINAYSLPESQDHCNEYQNCASCVASPFCGWCSSPVSYKNGAPGQQCAGFNSKGSNPFICNGVYSTKTCARGWQCNVNNYTCEQNSAPGSGSSQPICEANCSTTGKTFSCDNTTNECKVASAGQGTSLPVCEASCKATTAPSSHHPASHHPSSHHPSSHHPSSHHPASHSPASHHPETPAPSTTYVCDTTTFTCKASTDGKGSNQAMCESQCKASNHTPTALLGLWRGFSITAPTGGTNDEEVDFNFTTDSVTIVGRNDTQIAQVTTIAAANQLWLTAGDRVQKCIYRSDLPLPETVQELLACGQINAPVPENFTSAMNPAEDQIVMILAKCVNSQVNCTFHLGPNNNDLNEASLLQSLTRRISRKVQAPVTDPCTNYAANCTFCIAHPDCGWCSADVVYNGGQAGTRCAGFNPSGGKNPFTCSGSYSTEECIPGFTCDDATQMCTPTQAGSGVPKAACDTSCKSKKGPPTELVGNWRGLFIQEGYNFGVVSIKIKASNVTIQLPGVETLTATIKHIGGEVFLTYTSGPLAGSQIAGIFTIQYAELATYIDLAFGGANENAPTSYPDAMVAPSTQLFLAKCTAPTCVW